MESKAEKGATRSWKDEGAEMSGRSGRNDYSVRITGVREAGMRLCCDG